MIRPTVPADADRLVELAAATGFFRPDEVDTLRGVLDDYFAAPGEHGCFTSEAEGGINGFVYIGPEEMTDRAWCLWWIAVDPAAQGRGVGRGLLGFAEAEARRWGGRVMFIETSGLPIYDPTRRFYLKNGYDREAVLRDYYRDGDDLVIFRKRLADSTGATTDGPLAGV